MERYSGIAYSEAQVEQETEFIMRKRLKSEKNYLYDSKSPR